MFLLSVPEQLLATRRRNNSLRNAPLPYWNGDGGWGWYFLYLFIFFFKHVKLGGWIIQYKWKLWLLLLTVSYLVAGTHKQNYTLTTPSGSRGSKNERPSGTHLNLRGTQMSPLFLFYNFPPLFSNLLLRLSPELSRTSLQRIPPWPVHAAVRRSVWGAIPVVLRRRHGSAGGGEERLWGPCKKKKKLVFPASIHNVPSLIRPLWLSVKFKEAGRKNIWDGSKERVIPG